MHRGVWFGALALGLGGVLTNLQAQVNVWRSVARPTSGPVTVRAASPSDVKLDRPVALPPKTARGQGEQPRPFPPVYHSGNAITIQTANYPVAEAIATVPTSTQVIAVSNPSLPATLPAPGAETGHGKGAVDEQGFMGEEVFAGERMKMLPGAPQGMAGPPAPAPTPTPGPITGPMPGSPAAVSAPLKDWRGIHSTGVPSTPGANCPPGVACFPGAACPPGVSFSPSVPCPQHPGLPQEAFTGAEPLPKRYLQAEYLLWWMKNDRTPLPLVTTASNPNQPFPGAIGNPDTQVLFDGVLDRNAYSGVRLTAGCFLDDARTAAFEVSGFFLPENDRNFTVNSLTNPIISRPFFPAQGGAGQVQTVALPRFTGGQVDVTAPSQFWGAEANFLCKWKCGCDYRIDLLGGVRYLNLQESLNVTETIDVFRDIVGAPAFLAGTRVTVQDRFATRNDFYGGQVGVQGRYFYGPFSIDGRVKIAAGVTHQRVAISGSETFSPPNPFNDGRPGGLLALASNIGTYSRNEFAVVPEVGVSLGYNLTDNLRVSVGYNFLYWSNVVRPGDQIDPVLDPTLIPNFPSNASPVTPPRPAPLFKDTDVWVHGLTAGVELRF